MTPFLSFLAFGSSTTVCAKSPKNAKMQKQKLFESDLQMPPLIPCPPVEEAEQLEVGEVGEEGEEEEEHDAGVVGRH